MARSKRRRQAQTSENDSRIDRTASGRNSCSSGSWHITARFQSWRRVAQNEVNHSFGACGTLSATRTGARYDLEDTFDPGHVQRLSKQLDTSALEKTSPCPPPRWGG